MAYRNIREYEFTNFNEELYQIEGTHTNTIGRESEVILNDEFAKAILIDEFPVLYEQVCQGWARSFYTLEGHMQAILAYAQPDTPRETFDQTIWDQAYTAVQNELRSLPKARAFDVNTELDKVPYEQSSSAGYGYRSHKGPPGGETHMRAISRVKPTLMTAIRPDEEGPEYTILESVPDIGYTRTQLADLREKTKVRGVWGRAFHYILIEGTAARPLLENFMLGTTFMHIGSDPQLSVPRILHQMKREGSKWLYALDWSSFDSSVTRFEINCAFNLLKERIEFPNEETELAFELSRILFKHKKLAAPDGNIYMIHKGIPSGSYYTSIVGSVVNRLRIEYIWRVLFSRSPHRCYTQGDDSLIGETFLVEPETVAREAAKYGWIMNPDKTEYSTDPGYVTFLGRTAHGFMNARSLDKCLRLLMFPEYPVTSGRISAYRAESIARDCGGLSEVINLVARRLRRQYGVASEDEVPHYFKRYVA
ncbi:putative RNA-dependent RNA polymerase [Beet cryptic virus 3]|uniref:Putative RNA-dependent RNA polymerase protein n=1 Tax=Beet cryptic virus 3 TaxID=29257 RepID=Q86632_9VIRU|nr:putative RNA-dependent RNA polymerase [Beet cryptic virus 3]AAB27624.1 putative RNA-dependent RNA polymerase [Beet cryptic virus 3]